jgi:hypothetical protein
MSALLVAALEQQQGAVPNALGYLVQRAALQPAWQAGLSSAEWQQVPHAAGSGQLSRENHSLLPLLLLLHVRQP